MGHITDSFGERMDPFSGEGAFHRALMWPQTMARRARYPLTACYQCRNSTRLRRLVVIDHGFGITTWYAHLSAFSAIPGARVKRGSGRLHRHQRSLHRPARPLRSPHEQRPVKPLALHALYPPATKPSGFCLLELLFSVSIHTYH